MRATCALRCDIASRRRSDGQRDHDHGVSRRHRHRRRHPSLRRSATTKDDGEEKRDDDGVVDANTRSALFSRLRERRNTKTTREVDIATLRASIERARGRLRADVVVKEEAAEVVDAVATENTESATDRLFGWVDGVSKALLGGGGGGGGGDDDESEGAVEVESKKAPDVVVQSADATVENADADENADASTTAPAPAQTQGGWFRWNEGWNVSESVARATSGWIPTRNDFVTGEVAETQQQDDGGGKVPDFMRRLPLPPWIRQRVAGDKSTSQDMEEDRISYDTTATTSYVDDAIRDANSTAVSVTSAAIEKLNSALLAIEKVEENVVREGKIDPNSTALVELQEALRMARIRAREAREASQALEEAVQEVNRVKARSKDNRRDVTSGENDDDALKEADDAVLRAVKNSNNAVAEASRQVAFVSKRADALGTATQTMDDDLQTSASTSASSLAPAPQLSRRRRLMNAIASARESAQDALVASELTQTVSRLTTRFVNTARADNAATKTGVSAEELSAMVKPALQKVVANALDPTSDDDINAARVACSLSAWVYYLPTMQHALPRNRLRLITSSLDASAVIPTKQFVAGMALVEESNARALESLQQADAAARAAARNDAAREIAASKAAAEAAQRAIEQLQLAAELCANTNDDSKKQKARETAAAARDYARQAQEKFEEVRAVAAANKKMMEKMRMKRDLAELERQMQQTVIEQQRRQEEARIKQERLENATLPVNFCVAAHDDSATLWVVVEGSTNFASWQANLTFQPVTFEDDSLNVTVHRGAYTAAKTMYGRIERAAKEHVAKHGARAKIRITGHSIGGSIAMILGLMLLVRNGAPRYALADVWTFGAPYVMNGGDALLARFGLPRSFIKDVMMGDDVVPRSFSCYYPQWARAMLDSAPGPFKVDTKSPSFLDEEMFYVPMGDVLMLQAMCGESHPLLPPGPGLYTLNGDGVYEMLATRSRDAGDDDEDDESWLNRRASSGEWGDGVEEEADDDTSAGIPSRKADVSDAEAALRVNQLACLTQSDAALTASLIVSHIKEDDLLLNAGGMASVLQQRGRDAAQRVLLNTPHPLTILSNPGAYGDRGIISRHHNPFNYSKALSSSRKMKPGKQDFVVPKNVVDGAPASQSPR